MSILPFQQGDVVFFDRRVATVEEVRGVRLVVRTCDDVLHITTEDRLREQQPRRPAA